MDKNIEVRRDYPAGFIAAVADALTKAKRDASATGVSITAKLLYTNTVLPLRVNDKVQNAANPHYLGGNVDKIEDTISRMGL